MLSNKERENIRLNIIKEFSNPSISTVCDLVIGSVSTYPKNEKEDFLEKIKEIGKDIERFELSENDVIKPKSSTLPTNGPNLDPT